MYITTEVLPGEQQIRKPHCGRCCVQWAGIVHQLGDSSPSSISLWQSHELLQQWGFFCGLANIENGKLTNAKGLLQTVPKLLVQGALEFLKLLIGVLKNKMVLWSNKFGKHFIFIFLLEDS